jgi:hypothetical protein
LFGQLVRQLQGRPEDEEGNDKEETVTAIPIIARPKVRFHAFEIDFHKEITKTIYEEVSTAITDILEMSISLEKLSRKSRNSNRN